MPKNLSRYTKLLVVSDTGIYQKDGKTYAFGPVVKELNEMLTLFERITWIGFNREDQKKNLSYIEIKSSNIKTITLKPVGGNSILDKFKIIYYYPKMWLLINSEIKKHNYIHSRFPSNPAFISLILSKKYLKKQFWFKYAGSWVDKTSFFYNFQRKKLKNLKTNSVVTVNGVWKNQSKNVIAFENPCLDEDDRKIGKIIVKEKELANMVNFCFVGGLNKNKGVDKIIEVFKTLNNNNVGTLHIVGNGNLCQSLKKEAHKIKTQVIFYGFLPKNKVVTIYEKSHFIILPSQSEGFPKVIGEAMNYGCLPIVSDVSCINQYIQNDRNGVLINSVTTESVKKSLFQSLKITNKEFLKYIDINYRIAERFTFNHYLQRIKNEVFEKS